MVVVVAVVVFLMVVLVSKNTWPISATKREQYLDIFLKMRSAQADFGCGAAGANRPKNVCVQCVVSLLPQLIEPAIVVSNVSLHCCLS